MTTSAKTLSTPGTKGFLLWAKENIPWVYQAYAMRGVGSVVATQGTTMGDVSDFLTTDLSSSSLLAPTDTVDQAVAAAGGLSASVSDPASAASTAPTSSSLTSIFSGLASAVGSVFLTKQQLDTQNQLVQLQLQRAQAGLPPLNVSSLGLPQLGPTLNLGLSSTTQSALFWVLGIGGGVLLLSSVLGGRRRSRA
ncbi:MAG: hypothetical protein ACRDLF_14940 [Solirubrobacteraceae bacterium]